MLAPQSFVLFLATHVFVDTRKKYIVSNAHFLNHGNRVSTGANTAAAVSL